MITPCLICGREAGLQRICCACKRKVGLANVAKPRATRPLSWKRREDRTEAEWERLSQAMAGDS